VLKRLLNLFRDEEMRKRVWITLGILVVYRLGCNLPVPGARLDVIRQMLQQAQSPLTGIIDLVSGGALRNVSVFALGIMPYITSTIIMQLLQGVVPQLEQLAKEGAKGYEKIRFYHRCGTIVICFFQSTVYYRMWSHGQMPVIDATAAQFVATVTILTSGTMLLMWLGDQITEYGIGNGISLIIMSGIVARFPAAVRSVAENMSWQVTDPSGIGVLTVLAMICVFVGVIVGVVFITQGQRRIPMQQAKITRGTRVLGGQRTYLPLRVNHASVMPIIFASSLLMFPAVIFDRIAGMAGGSSFWGSLADSCKQGHLLYTLIFVPMIFFFCYFWTSMTFKPKELSDDLKQYGSFVPGIRPGKKTAVYLENVMVRITFAGAAFLSTIALMPQIVGRVFDVGQQYALMGFYGGTGLLIVVGVGLDLMERLESQLIQKHYGGFLGTKGGRIRGRR